MTSPALERDVHAVRVALDNLADAERLAAAVRAVGQVQAQQYADAIIERTLRETPPVKAAVAASLLELSARTVRDWVAAGLLTRVGTTQPMRIDLASLHDVLDLVRDLREAGTTRGLRDEVWHRLSDQALMASDDFQESVAQMRRGEGVVLVPRDAT